MSDASWRDRVARAEHVPLSERCVTTFGDAERLLLWALRHRVATGDATSPHLVRAFAVLCGPAIGPRARDSLDAFVVALDAHARRPLAFLGWCDQAVAADEADVLDLFARLQHGLPADAQLDDLVGVWGQHVVRAAARRLVGHLTDAGLRLPARWSLGPGDFIRSATRH